ncbi:MAG: aromatic amino acid ammonia-lyase [Schleiferiaceae bacterium]|nr:aromatic amino acid ammonia-lyase [Schleiferiaceae bacterium]
MSYLTLNDIENLVYNKENVALSPEKRERVTKAFDFLKEFSKDKVIYGINTGFGPMAQYRVDDKNLQELQFNLVRSHANGMGESLTPDQTRAIMICRLNTLSLGYSGTHPTILETLVEYINKEIYPLIPSHGSVGASGDLVQLAHLALGLIGEGNCYYQGEIISVSEALKMASVSKVDLQLRDGLSLINGTSCMSGVAALNLIQLSKLLHFTVLTSSIMNELTASYNDSFSKELNEAKMHIGQRVVAERMRDILKNGNVLKNRNEHLFDSSRIEGQEYFSEKVQEYYSLRCVPQIIGPVYDAYLHARKVLEEEINSANDNPIVCADSQSVYHGGNFHGDYIAFEMDKVKIGVTKLGMLVERQINYLLNHRLNQKFPPFLNAGKLGFNFGLQGMQFSAVSTAAENQSLSTSVYIHTIPNNGDNQDIVSMGTNAALQTQKVIDNTFEILSVQMVAIAQAIDLDGSLENLSTESQELYRFIRKHIEFVKEDEPKFENLKNIKEALITSKERLQ